VINTELISFTSSGSSTPNTQHPTPLCFSIHMQEAQAAQRALFCFRHGPDLETALCVYYPAFIQIEGVQGEGFSFGQKNASKGGALVAIRVSVADIYNLQLASRHEFSDIATSGYQLPFLVERGLQLRARRPHLQLAPGVGSAAANHAAV